MKLNNKVRYFYWQGTNQSGKKVSGVKLGYQQQTVREQLQQQKIRVKKLKARAPSTWMRIRNQLKPQDITAITRQIGTMLQSGLPIVQALKLIATSHHKAEACAVLTQVCAQVEAGSSLANAIAQSSPLFDDLYCDLVATGEQTGQLGEIFLRLALYREKKEAINKKVVKALIYPTLVTLTAIAVSALMLVVVIPQFTQIFNSFGAELPYFTQLVVQLSDALIESGHYILMLMLAGILLFRYSVKRSAQFKLKVHRNHLTVPIFGNILLKATVARSARTLATTFSAGIPLLDGLEAAGKTAGNKHIEQAIKQAHHNTASGMPLHIALRESDAFPELMLQMTMIGEESGALDDMLNKIAALYEDDVDNTVDNLGRIIEPFIIIFIAVIVGGLLAAMYIPVFKMMSVIG